VCVCVCVCVYVRACVCVCVTEYRVWVLEPRVQQQYTAYFSILNRELTASLTSDSSPEFRSQARHVQHLVSLNIHFYVGRL